MTFLYLLAPSLAFVLLIAHFFRASNWIGLALALSMIALLFVRRPLAARTAQLALVLGAVEWIRSALLLIQERSALAAPYFRLALILGGVALFTLLAVLVFQCPRIKARYRIDGGAATTWRTDGDG